MTKRNITLVHASRASVAPLMGYYPMAEPQLEITNLIVRLQTIVSPDAASVHPYFTLAQNAIQPTLRQARQFASQEVVDSLAGLVAINTNFAYASPFGSVSGFLRRIHEIRLILVGSMTYWPRFGPDSHCRDPHLCYITAASGQMGALARHTRNAKACRRQVPLQA